MDKETIKLESKIIKHILFISILTNTLDLKSNI